MSDPILSPHQDTPSDDQQRAATSLADFLTTNRSAWYILDPPTLSILMADTPHTPQSITLVIGAGLDPVRDHKTFYARDDNGPWEVSYR